MQIPYLLRGALHHSLTTQTAHLNEHPPTLHMEACTVNPIRGVKRKEDRATEFYLEQDIVSAFLFLFLTPEESFQHCFELTAPKDDLQLHLQPDSLKFAADPFLAGWQEQTGLHSLFIK